MSATVSMITPDPAADEARRQGLRRMRTVAVGLLGFAAVVYVATLGKDGALGFVNAGAEASMVGAIADWFAVTAIFKHPLGLPIPHTALIPKRKDELGRGLQEFVADNFLQESIIRERVAAATITLRVAEWLSDPAHVRRLVDEVAEVASIALSKVRDEHVEELVRTALVPRFREEPISPLLGGLLQEVVADDLHHGLVDLALEELHRWLALNQDAFTEMLSERAPWWAPPRLNEAVTQRIHTEAVRWIEDIRNDPDHHARAAFDSMLTQLAHDLLFDPATQARAEGLKNRVLEHPAVLTSSVSLWNALRRSLVALAARPRRRGARPAPDRGDGVRDAAARRRRPPAPDGPGRRRRRGLHRGAVRHRADHGHHPHDRALGRPGGGPTDRAARGPRPAVHPDQRHHRRRPGRGRHPQLLGAAVIVDVPLRDASIRLGQFLKLANLIDSGSDAKPLLAAGEVLVNGEVETRRGRRLVVGDVVTLGGASARVGGAA